MNAPALTSTNPVKYAVVDAAADGDNSIVAAVSGKKIRVVGYGLTITGGTAILRDAAADTARAKFISGATTHLAVSYAGGPAAPAFETASGQGLEVNNGTGVDTFGHVAYQEV